MSTMNFCRLCVNIGIDFKNVYDENGEANEVYGLTSKYFDESLLITDDPKHLIMICLQCWDQIWNFHNFQQAVYVAQTNLDAIKQLEFLREVKPEEMEVKASPLPEDDSENCINLLESEESTPALIEPVLKFSLTVGTEAHTEITESSNVDLTVDESEMNDQEDFNVEFIDRNSDSESALYETGSRNTPDTLTASECGSRSPNEGSDDDVIIADNYESLDPIKKQISRIFQKSPKAWGENFAKYADTANLICFLCFDKCCGLRALFSHFNRFHPNKIVHILCCKCGYQGMPSIARHLATHYDQQFLYMCDKCCKTYKRISYLKRHVLNAHPG